MAAFLTATRQRMPKQDRLIREPMRVTHIYRTYFPDPPGGLQEAIRQICATTALHGVRQTVFALSPNPQPARVERAECEVIRARSWAAPASCDLGGLGAFRAFSRLAASSDLLHYQFPWPFADVLHLATRPQVPAVMTYQSDVVRQKFLGALYAPLMHKMLRAMRFVVATSPAYAASSPVLTQPGIRERVRVIPLGIDERTYNQTPDNTIFARLGLAADEPYFLFIGVLRYYKGLHTLVQAARDVGARIVIAGAGPQASVLKQQAAALGLNNLIFAGQISDPEKIALLKSCHALVLPSHLRSEAFGMVLVEAAIFGRPQITCEISTGTSYVNAHGESGLVVAPEQPVQLADAMTQLLNNAPLAASLGEGARRRYERLFSGPALGRAYFELYREALS